MKNAEHHLYTRKWLYKRLGKYPHPNIWKRIIDIAVFLVGGLGPLFTIPQLMRVWIEKNADGLSLITWMAYSVFSFVWLLYGIAHKEKPIIFANAMHMILNTIIVIGIMAF